MYIVQVIFNGQNIYLSPSKRSLWPWSYGSWIHNYLCSQCLSPL